jgi:hypothetical protein
MARSPNPLLEEPHTEKARRGYRPAAFVLRGDGPLPEGLIPFFKTYITERRTKNDSVLLLREHGGPAVGGRR